jgi:hypothetical protein
VSYGRLLSVSPWAENLLERTSYSGYPLVSNAREMLLVGYIARRELQRALGTPRPTLRRLSLALPSPIDCGGITLRCGVVVLLRTEAARTNGAFGDSTYCCIAQEFSSPQLDAQPEFHLRPWMDLVPAPTSSY